MVATIRNNLEKSEPLNLPIKIGNISRNFFVDSGNPCSSLNNSLAVRVVNSIPFAMRVLEIIQPQLRTFSNEPIHIEVMFRTAVTSNGWHTSATTFIVVVDGLKPLIGCDLFDQLRLAVTQT